METYQIFSAVFLIAVLVLILPAFLKTNNDLTRLVKNLSIWTVIVLIIIVIINLYKWKESIYQ